MQHCKYNKEKKKNFKRKQGKERDRQLIPLSKCITTANQMPGCPFLCGPLCPALWDTCSNGTPVAVPWPFCLGVQRDLQPPGEWSSRFRPWSGAVSPPSLPCPQSPDEAPVPQPGTLWSRTHLAGCSIVRALRFSEACNGFSLWAGIMK